MQIRDATENDLESIFMMGFDAWSEGCSSKDYLDACFSSEKYKSGHWKVLNDSNQLLASLIVYPLSATWFGIGSISTPATLRRQGWGSKITFEIASQLESLNNAEAVFLFADINPVFYQRLGFVPLPSEFQKYTSSTCMIRSMDPKKIWETDGFKPPRYF